MEVAVADREQLVRSWNRGSLEGCGWRADGAV
jgi:hypothetical protein